MKKTVLIVLTLCMGLSAFSQMRRDRIGNPVINKEPSEKEIEKYKREVAERQQEYLSNFLTTLEADDFQKEIIRQYLNSYYEEKMALFKIKYERTFERKEAVKKLDNTHFKELESLISEEDMSKIKEMIKGNFDEKEVKKKRKKKRKKHKKD